MRVTVMAAVWTGAAAALVHLGLGPGLLASLLFLAEKMTHLPVGAALSLPIVPWAGSS